MREKCCFVKQAHVHAYILMFIINHVYIVSVVCGITYWDLKESHCHSSTTIPQNDRSCDRVGGSQSRWRRANQFGWSGLRMDSTLLGWWDYGYCF